MKNIKTLLKKAIVFLQKNGIKNAEDSAERLLSHVLKIPKSDLYSRWDIDVLEIMENRFNQLIKRRAKKEPVDYIIGETDFYGCAFTINSSVLIPRQETEILVDRVADVLKNEDTKNKILFDICAGSGCIGISLKKKFESLKVYLSDISRKALNVAKQNAKKNNVRVFFKNGFLLKPFNLKADYVVCNPPYVAHEEFETLEDDVRNFEPKIALAAKDKGFEYYIEIEKQIFKYLKPKAKLFFEIGHAQKDGILAVFSSEKWKNKQVYPDFSGKSRFFFVEIE